MKRKRVGESGALSVEYYDFIFPDESGAAPSLKLMEAAERWKRRKTAAEAEPEPEDTAEDMAEDEAE